jgi:dipeptidyl aminopeptidase/acylaminoacyl peptidase
MNRLAAAVLVIPLFSCAEPGGSGPSPEADWLTAERTFEDNTVRIERVTYRSSGGLRIVGQVCRTTILGRRPVIVVNHGGFEGLGADWNGGLCKTLAQAGFVVIESSYRGEDGSEGTVEFCLGEVDDVLAMLDIALAQPYADRDKVSMIGLSHGGCIGLRALERGAPVQAAVDVFGPTEAVSLVQFWQARVAAGDPNSAAYRELIQQVVGATGGPPASGSPPYVARSPVAFAPGLDAWPGRLLMVHGTDDPLIPVGQSCLMASQMRDVRAYYRDAIRPLAGPPPGCPASGLSWLTDGLPAPRWPERRYLMVYRGAGHDLGGATGAGMLADVLSFLAEHAS